MTPAEFTDIELAAPTGDGTLVTVDHLTDRTARTLLYGYNCERHTWHVYLDAQGTLHRVVYAESRGVPLLLSYGAGPAADCFTNAEYVPDKRLYMESCDLEFCTLLHHAGISLSFTTYDEAAAPRRLAAHSGFAGRIREEFDDQEAQFLFTEIVMPDLGSGRLGHRCLMQAALELKLPHIEDENGVYVQGHLVPAMTEWLDAQSAQFKATREPASNMDDVLADLKWLAGTLDAHHPDVVQAADTSMPTGVVTSRLHLHRELTRDSFNRHTGNGSGTLEELGAGAFHVRNTDDGVDVVVLPQSSQTGTYAVYWKQFGSDAYFESQFQPALQYLLQQAAAGASPAA